MPKTRRDGKQASTQSEAFIKAARELGCDEDEDAFDRKLKKVATAPAPPRPHERASKTNKRVK